MDTLVNLIHGFYGLWTFNNMLAVFTGCFVGTIVGILPGLGPSAAMAILLPMTLGMGPSAGLIMLSGIFFGIQYGGSTTSILMHIPGEASSMMTCIEGYEMTKRGRAGAALTAAAVGSFIAATLGFVAMTFIAMPLARFALRFGPPEFFAIGLVGLIVLANVSGGNTTKNFIMILFGTVLASIGMDPLMGLSRFDFGITTLTRGIDYIPVLIGVFGMAEILNWVIDREHSADKLPTVHLRDLYPTKEEWRRMIPAIFRGGGSGFLIGLLPGPGGLTATYVAFAIEKRFSKYRHEFGQGAIEGVAGPESANNAGSVGQLVPLLSLGLPFSGLTAIMLGALMMQGITPGPLFIVQRPEVFWTVIASFYFGNVILLILNLPLVGLTSQVLRIPMWLLMAIVTLLCCIGTYTISNDIFDVYVMLFFGIFGYFMRRYDYQSPPLVLGMVFGPILERSFAHSLVMFNGEITGLFMRPISGAIFGIAVLAFLVLFFLKRLRQKMGMNNSALR